MRILSIALLAAVTTLAAGCSAPARQALPASAPASVPDAPILLPTPTPASTGAAGVTQPPSLLPELHNWGPAPELGNTEWLNSPPLRLADLRGQVALVEFWTFGCINCQHVTPTLQRWHQQYSQQGLVVVSVHTPEFAYEKDAANVAAAVQHMEITWPVAIDNDWQTWRAYNNRFWPAMYLVDKEGNIRYLAIGEGNYERTEAVIAALLAE
ncbi:MAG: redoxin domain-containing protein [Caldilineaceae bacterium]